jgi:hypothetical protein
MPTAIHPELLAGLQQGLFFSLCVGLALSGLWGLWLVMAPDRAQRFAMSADQWVPTEAWFARLNQPVETTRWFYRYHHAAGLLISAGAAYALWRWHTAYERESVIGMLDRRLIHSGMDWLIPAGEWIFLAFNSAILVFGMVVLFRPSLLKTPERWANRWVEVEADRALDRKFDPLARAVEAHPRVLGLLVAGTCAYLLWRLLSLA